MSDTEKGEILRKVSELPPLQKERALGFLQGLTAATADTNRSTTSEENEKEKEAPANG